MKQPQYLTYDIYNSSNINCSMCDNHACPSAVFPHHYKPTAVLFNATNVYFSLSASQADTDNNILNWQTKIRLWLSV